jgi:Protein of unknown function (DUF2934)
MPSNAIKHEDIDRNSTGVLLSSHRREKSDPPATLLTLRLPVFIRGWCGIAELSCSRHGKRTFDYRSAARFQHFRYRRATIHSSSTMLREKKAPTIAQDPHMDQSLENRIRERAYEMWTAKGRVHGQAEQHWLAAEREILTAATTELARDKVPQKKKRRSPTRSKVPRPLKAAS